MTPSVVRANVNESYFRRFLLVGLVVFAYGGWCIYDGMVAYPKKLKKAEFYHGLYDQELNEKQIKEAWIEKTEKMGWERGIPEKPKKIRDGIQWQYIQLAVCAVLAAFLLGKYFLAFGHWVESDGREIRSSFHKTFPISEIQKVDKTKWEKKGIAQVHHQGGVFVFDDFKFDRKKLGEILVSVEKTLTDDQFIGGNREAEKGQKETES